MSRGSRASTAAVGVVFGFLITGCGFGNYATIHQALLFRSWYLFAVFGSAVAVAAAGLALLRRAGTTRYGGPLRLPHGPARRLPDIHPQVNPVWAVELAQHGLHSLRQGHHFVRCTAGQLLSSPSSRIAIRPHGFMAKSSAAA